jgi:hypothetical protein
MPAIDRTLWTAVLLCALGGRARAADDFPYTAYVVVDEAEVVAGPGHRFYATERLPRGAKVEIYREESSGWLAIRPPDGSFSWVAAVAVERSEGDEIIGRVKEPTPAWVGTAAERVGEHRQQVALKAGELVRILGEKSVGKGDDEQVWLKIAPPAGEFRWIHLRDVGRQMPELEERVEAVETEEAEEVREKSRPIESSIALRDLAMATTRHDALVQQAQFRSEVKPVSPDGFTARKRREGDALQSVSTPSVSRTQPDGGTRLATSARSAQNERKGNSTSPQATKAADGIAADQMARKIEQLEVELSIMLAQDKSLWNLAGLRTRIEQLVERGDDPISRGRARLLLDKIRQIEGAFGVEDHGSIATSTSSPAASNTAVADKSNPLADPRYDAEGWLKPVVSRKSDKPIAPYAVVNQEGQPVCFVTPSPGLNLHRYLNKQVGVYGRRGYLEELKRPHVTAERVIDLERHLR